MKQVLQNLRDGSTVVVDVPVPAIRPGFALVHTAASLVSAGTERTLVEFAEKNLIGKARSRPDLVRQVMDKARREGLLPTIEAAFNRLDQPSPLGYSSSGTIVAVGSGLEGFKPGDRAACAGGGYAVHAEYAIVPQNLLAHLPDSVDFEQAAFATLGAIAMHGFRLAQPQLGERVAIIGLGLLGLLAASIARAAGCRVFGVDLDPARIALAQRLGFTASTRGAAVEEGRAFSNGQGFDVVLICADTTSSDPVELAGQLCRDRGHVIASGAVGINIPRRLYFEKELHFQVSRSYGPGRYDPNYEERGVDYPAGYVRWSEGRNLQAFVDLLAAGQVDVRPLISHRYPIEQAPEAYTLITGKKAEPFLGVLLTYDQAVETEPVRSVRLPHANLQPVGKDAPGIGVLGAGSYATAVFLPAVQKVGGARRVTIASAAGLHARHAAERFGFEYAASSEGEVLENQNVDAVAILTRHDSHARLIQAALEHGKHVYCEKPLALNAQELLNVFDTLKKYPQQLLVAGFNRRFAPLGAALQQFLSRRSEPFMAHYRVNAGYLPDNHWLHDPQQGGGRIVGEGCHFFDFLTFLAGAPPISVNAQALPNLGRYHNDNVSITLTFPDGSLGVIDYLANGDRSVAKERVEVFSSGRVAVLDDFRTLEMVHDGRKVRRSSPMRQDKGHQAAWQTFLQAIQRAGEPPIPYEQLWGVTSATFAALESLAAGCKIDLPAADGP
jgi:predicted dehydrogenase